MTLQIVLYCIFTCWAEPDVAWVCLCVLQAFMGGTMCPFLVLKVRRGPYLLSDTLLQINGAKNDGSLKKPLKVCV
jgi:hypothetical protein